ncbi:trypsin-like serine peptidase [Streptomyces sp. NBC_01465]|uniref:trypsin-like serine peptidase n=1 Tax=Streptomyces sp. NBC_01465 TaxID=2903878 RepID=UPI002E352075|nr:trypsin-like serine protease [Streptomyces sp. NBC_01465]
MIGILSVVAAALTATLAPVQQGGQSADDIRAYWTPQRMHEAMAASAPDGDPAPPDGVPWTQGKDSVRQVGRLFMVLPAGQKATCTAAVVDSPNHDTIATAGHCVHLNEYGGFMKALMFVPGYDTDDWPHGGFAARSVGIAPAWADKEDHKADFAFVALDTDVKNRHVQDVVGARRAVFAPVAGEKTALGYPYVKPYDGETLQYCSGPTTPVDDPRLAGGEQLQPCRMTNGASGGPWYARTAQGEEVQVGVTSSRLKSAGADDEAWGAMFDDTARQLHDAQGKL